MLALRRCYCVAFGANGLWRLAPARSTVLNKQPPPAAGILLHGPPGCSKTLLARAVASQAKLNYISVKGPELFSKYVGESEKALAALFAK